MKGYNQNWSAAHIVHPGANLTWKTFRPFCIVHKQALKGWKYSKGGRSPPMDIKKNQALKGRSQDWNAAPIINPGANLIWITFDHFYIVGEEALKGRNIAEWAKSPLWRVRSIKP